MSVLPAHMSVCQLYIYCPWRPKEGTACPGTEVEDGSMWKSNPDSLQEQKVLLAMKPAFQPSLSADNFYSGELH